MSNLLNDLPTAISSEAEQTLLLLGRTDDIVFAAIRPAFAYVKRLSRGRLQDDELLSAAYSALSKAVKNFNPGRGRFLSYSRPYLRGELAAEWRQKDPVRNAAKHETPVENPKPPEEPRVEAAFDEIHMHETWAAVQPIIGKVLTALEIRVLDFRFKQCLTLQVTGDRLGKSRERVRQLEAEALKKLRAALSNKI